MLLKRIKTRTACEEPRGDLAARIGESFCFGSFLGIEGRVVINQGEQKRADGVVGFAFPEGAELFGLRYPRRGVFLFTNARKPVHSHTAAPTMRSASCMRSSPEISLGSRVPRSLARERESLTLPKIASNTLVAVRSNC